MKLSKIKGLFASEVEKLQKQGGKIFLYQSKDDLSVSLVDLKKYKESLPEAEVVMFRKKGHFNQVEFPEIVENIKKLE